MSTIQMTMFDVAPARALNKAQRDGVRSAANLAYFTARREWFRTRSREMGGYTMRTRDQIDAECEAKGREAQVAVYARAGYVKCAAITCTRLASPGYTRCPECAK